MGSTANRLRKKWQDYSGEQASVAEINFFDVFRSLFQDTEFIIRAKPKELSQIYLEVPLSAQELSEIYTPTEPITRHGVIPDYAIDNTETNKTIYVEVKRQDGWVEGGKRSDGRGNAHERSCKFFTPGLLAILREQSHLEVKYCLFGLFFKVILLVILVGCVKLLVGMQNILPIISFGEILLMRHL